MNKILKVTPGDDYTLLVEFEQGKAPQDSGNPTDCAAKIADNSPGTRTEQPGKLQNFSESYAAYIKIKSGLFGRLSDGLSESQFTASMALLGMSKVDVYLMPMMAMGVDEDYAQSTLAHFNFTLHQVYGGWEPLHDHLHGVYFDTVIKGFAMPDSVLTGVETRSSAPVRINRDENAQSNVQGLYPMGEGAGYAGGIMSSAVDGIKTAEKIMLKYAPLQ